MKEDETIRLLLECLKFISPGNVAQVGQSGLVRLLLGQPTALGTRASNPYKGKLAGKLKSRDIEKVLEQLVKMGWLEEVTCPAVLGGTYQALRLGEAGLKWLAVNQLE